MCENHTKLFGSDAVVSFERIARGMDKACDRRIAYLEQQVELFKKYIDGQAADGQQVVAGIVARHFDAEGDVSDMLVDASEANDVNGASTRLDVEEELCEALQGLYHNVAMKATSRFYGIESRLNRVLSYWEGQQSYADGRKAILVAELQLCGVIQDHLDTLKTRKGWVIALGRIQDLYALGQGGRLSWDSYVVMANQCHMALDRELILPRFESRPLTNTIEYWERAQVWAREAMKVASELAVELQPVVSGEEEIDMEMGEFSSSVLFGQITWGFSGKTVRG